MGLFVCLKQKSQVKERREKAEILTF